MNTVTSVIDEKIYPIVAKALDKNDAKYRAAIGRFMNKNHEKLYAEAPYEPIYWLNNDKQDLYNSIGINETEILNLLKTSFFWDLNFNPVCIKEPDVVIIFLSIKYYLIKKKRNFAELASLYLSFNGKFYASLFTMAFLRLPPSKYRNAMEYTVNNMMSEKFDLRREGTIFGAIKSMITTWLDKYGSEIIDKNDDDTIAKRFIQQLRDREKAFLKNISELYHEAVTDKLYMNYETDNLSEDKFRLTDNDAAKAARLTELSMNYMTSNYVNLDFCNKCKDINVKSLEIKDIIESILSNNNNLPDIRRVINILICDYFREYPRGDCGSIEFVSYSIKAKPNTKDEYLLEMKDTILKWLDENSPNYRKRKSRTATAISYYRSILLYFVLVINRVANK